MPEAANAPRLLVVDLAATSRNWSLPEEGRRRIAAATPRGWRVHFVSAPTVSDGDGGRPPSDEALRVVAGAEAYFGFGLSQPVFEAGRVLRWVHSAVAGVGAALFPEMVASDVLLTNSAGIYGEPIAEYVLGGVLHFLRGFDFAVEQQQGAKWDKAPFVSDDSPVREVGDCDVLVVGAGGLGSAIARALSALGARCVGVRRRPELGVPEGFERVVGPDALDAELPRAQVIVLATPSTSETRELLDRERIARLRSDAIVVNVGRGSLLDEESLADALEEGRIRGAVLDVFREEPLAATSRLWRIRRALLTPHVSGVSPLRYWGRQLDLFIDNWARYSEGRPLRNLVDKRAGY